LQKIYEKGNKNKIIKESNQIKNNISTLTKTLKDYHLEEFFEKLQFHQHHPIFSSETLQTLLDYQVIVPNN